MLFRSHGVGPAVAATRGYQLAYQVGSVLLVIGGVLVLFLLEHVIAEARNPLAELEAEPQPEPA